VLIVVLDGSAIVSVDGVRQELGCGESATIPKAGGAGSPRAETACATSRSIDADHRSCRDEIGARRGSDSQRSKEDR